ncbi:hypothetical protein AEGHOMDF_4469 [Methylobacterium soli]|nr:hypothetical protein AEGHOMDF_4469 [Methylobacterium soli]
MCRLPALALLVSLCEHPAQRLIFLGREPAVPLLIGRLLHAAHGVQGDDPLSYRVAHDTTEQAGAARGCAVAAFDQHDAPGLRLVAFGGLAFLDLAHEPLNVGSGQIAREAPAEQRDDVVLDPAAV